MSKLRINELESLETGRSLKVDELAQTFDYEAGIKITSYSQMVRDDNGDFWRVSGQVSLPYTTTGTGLPEDGTLVPAGDAVLRQDIANPDKGALMVRGAVVYINTIADLQALDTSGLVDGQQVSVKEYHSGDGVGGGVFNWDSSSIADIDNGIIFGDVNETGRWIRVAQGERPKSEWYGPAPVTDGARFLANSTNENTSYSKDNSYYKKLLFKIGKPFAEIREHYPNVTSTTTQKCFIEWDRGIFWMSFFAATPDSRMIIAAVDIVTGSLLTVTAVAGVSMCFEIIKDGASRKLYVHHAGSLRYIDVTILPPIGVDSVATVATGLENVGYFCTYYNKHWYSFEKTTREEIVASAVKVYRLDGTLERGFAVPQTTVEYESLRNYASKHQSIRVINGEVVYAVGAGSRYTALLDAGVYTAANRHQFYQGLIRYSPQNNQQNSSLVDPLAYKDKFGFDELVESQDVTVLAGGGLATIVNDDTYVYVIEEFANSADINSVNLSNYQSVLPNLYNIPFDRIIQPSGSFGIANYNPNKLIDIYTLEEVTTWRGIVDKMVQYGVKEATVTLAQGMILGYWFGDAPVNMTGLSGLLTIRLRGNTDVLIDYTNYLSLELSTNRRFKISGYFYFDNTKASGLRAATGSPMIERFDTATKQMLYSTDFSDPAWRGFPFYTGV